MLFPTTWAQIQSPFERRRTPVRPFVRPMDRPAKVSLDNPFAGIGEAKGRSCAARAPNHTQIPGTLPAAHLDERALEVKLLLDHREDLVRSRSEEQQRLRWHLHDIWPELATASSTARCTGWRSPKGVCNPPAREFLAGKHAEGKSRMEALRALKRHLVRAVWQALRAAETAATSDSSVVADHSPNLRPGAAVALT